MSTVNFGFVATLVWVNKKSGQGAKREEVTGTIRIKIKARKTEAKGGAIPSSSPPPISVEYPL